jgi:hypothetical protein
MSKINLLCKAGYGCFFGGLITNGNWGAGLGDTCEIVKNEMNIAKKTLTKFI